MAYVTVLTDLNGVEVSELAGAQSKSGAIPVGSMATATVKVRLDHEAADFMLEGDALLKVYDDEVSTTEPLSHLRLITAEEVSAAGYGTVAANFADGYWTLLRRLIGKTPQGYSRGSAGAPVDRGTIISELVDATNAESPSGVRMGTVEASSSTYVAGWTYAKLAEKISELGATLDGPDWRIRPIEYAAGYYGELDVKPVIGALNLEAAFEYGPETLGNVKGYKRAVSLEGAANRLYNLPPGFPDNATQDVLMRQDAASQAARGLLEDLVAATGDLTVDELRIKLLEHHIAVRSRARQVITFDPVSDLGDRVPRYGRDFAVGDVVPFRASSYGLEGEPVKRIDALFRIYQVGWSVDDAGAVTHSLTVAPS